MEASTYAWAVIVTFFILFATIQLRKCFLQLLSSSSSSGERNATNRLSRSSVYTIENDVQTVPNDQDILGSMNKKKDSLPTYEEVLASDKQNPINHLSSLSEIRSTLDGSSVGTSSSNVTASNTSIDR